jgi:hypothetical protein
MDDPETFLIGLYVLIDEFVQTQVAAVHPGPVAALHPSEALTLAVFGQWGRFATERDFYRYAAAQLVPLFPRLPDRTQFNRQQRALRPLAERFALWLAARLDATRAPYEILDSTAARTRDTRRRGRGWLPGLADRSWSGRLGWYTGFHLLLSCDPAGVITGWGFGPASAQDRRLAETFFALRTTPDPCLASIGQSASGVYIADTGFAGRVAEARWIETYRAQVVSPPQPDSKRRWGLRPRRWLARLRQVIETVCDHLLSAFRLDRDRPHTLDGFRARLAATVALHNACIWFNRQAGRPDLALVEVLGW